MKVLEGSWVFSTLTLRMAEESYTPSSWRCLSCSGKVNRSHRALVHFSAWTALPAHRLVASGLCGNVTFSERRSLAASYKMAIITTSCQKQVWVWAGDAILASESWGKIYQGFWERFFSLIKGRQPLSSLLGSLVLSAHKVWNCGDYLMTIWTGKAGMMENPLALW